MAPSGSSTTSQTTASDGGSEQRSSISIEWRGELRKRMTSSKSPSSQNPGVLGSIGLPCTRGMSTINTAPSTAARSFTPGNGTPARACLQHGGILTPARRSETHARIPIRQELDELRAPDDARASDEVVFVQLALLEARRADVDRAAALREVVHQLPQRREALLVDRFGEASVREANAFDAQEHERLLARAERGV